MEGKISVAYGRLPSPAQLKQIWDFLHTNNNILEVHLLLLDINTY